ncbi:MAG TPA: NADH-quinone oxidoreductase subunit L [Anaerolineaceae bacterium]|nr:NADH-quinone oxidoreductase subunit L [Anaerolineaceae bacterium]
MSTPAILILLTLGLPWLGAVVVWAVGDRTEKISHTLAVIFAVLAAVAGLGLLLQTGPESVQLADLGGVFGPISFTPDGLGVFLAVVATFIGSLAVIFSVNYMHGEKQLSRYYAYMLFFIGAMVGLVLTSNMLLMFFFWEITALCSYALISFNSDDPKAVAGGVKALIMTQIGGIGLLLGALALYIYTGQMDFNVLLANPDVVHVKLLPVMAYGFLVAAAAKSAQFPFQTWLPDAMEAPTPISALIHAATMVNAGVYLLARFYPAFHEVPGWTLAVMLVGLVTALLAALMAAVANDLKRVLAYSTVSQLGYMVYAVGSGGIFASQFHLLSHSVFKALLFLAAGAVIHAVGTRNMRQMGGLGKQMPFTRVVFIIGALALAGIPVLNGFWSKELILEVGLKFAPWSYVLMVIGAGLTAFYTYRMVSMVFYGESHSHAHGDAGLAMKIALAPLALGALTTWLLAGPFAKLLSTETTLPYHGIEAASTFHILEEVISLPTLIALVVVVLGLLGWVFRSKLSGLGRALRGLGWAADNSFGFEAINRGIVRGISSAAEGLRVTQTGLLNWNVVGIVAGLLIVIAIIALGA